MRWFGTAEIKQSHVTIPKHSRSQDCRRVGTVMKVEMQRVHYMPKELNPGVLYVSEEFDIAMHLCACGCGSKVKTPLGPTEWSVEETKSGPSLRPSIGNWQQ